jgi:hypothetical protein
MRYCLDCSFVGEPKKYRPGTLLREVGLWLLILVPGILYFMWSLSADSPGILHSIWKLSAPYKPSTFAIEVALWLPFLAPGILYSVGRRWGSYEGCATCRSRRIVPMDSPLAHAGLSRLSPTPSARSWVCDKCGKPIFGGGRFCESCAPSGSGATDEGALKY